MNTMIITSTQGHTLITSSGNSLVIPRVGEYILHSEKKRKVVTVIYDYKHTSTSTYVYVE